VTWACSRYGLSHKVAANLPLGVDHGGVLHALIRTSDGFSNEMRSVAFCLNLLVFCLCLQASAQEQKAITVKLVNIMSVEGESTGWASA
jgi:hypothetical protein